MDAKIVLKFLADVLYIKGYIYFSEYDAILDSCDMDDLDEIVERMLRDDFSPYQRGECYIIRENTGKRENIG